MSMSTPGEAACCVRDDGRIVLESSDLKVLIDPSAGGRIRSLFSKRTQTEYFYLDSRVEFSGDGFSDNDISGFLDCFPIVAACEYPDGSRRGLNMGDHGCLWQTPWEARIAGDVVHLVKDAPEWECRVEKVLMFKTSSCVRLDYSITNLGDELLNYIYSAHPLLRAEPGTKLLLPSEMDKSFIYMARNVPGLADGEWTRWPPSEASDMLANLDVSTCSVVKAFSSRLSSGRAGIWHPGKDETLVFEFDTRNLPYLGVLYSQGFDADLNGHFRDQLFLALEPTTGIGDDLPTCMQTETVAMLAKGQTANFWIEIFLNS